MWIHSFIQPSPKTNSSPLSTGLPKGKGSSTKKTSFSLFVSWGVCNFLRCKNKYGIFTKTFYPRNLPIWVSKNAIRRIWVYIQFPKPFRRVSKSAPPARCGRGISDPQRSSKSFQDCGGPKAGWMWRCWETRMVWATKKTGPYFVGNTDWLMMGSLFRGLVLIISTSI